jgi:Silicon transporter
MFDMPFPLRRVGVRALKIVSDSESAPRAPRRRYETVTACLRTACAQHGLDQEHLIALLPSIKRSVIAYTFGSSTTPPRRGEMRRLVRHVEDVLDLGAPLSVDLASPTIVALRALRSVIAAITLAISGWIVIGAILTSHNQMADSTSPAITLATLVGALVMLGLLEAAHIGAVALSTADVSMLTASHPRVIGLHRHIDTKHKLEEYLAARQFGVVLVVFAISYVTRIGTLTTFPGTSIAFPNVIKPLLDIGAPGALMVLVFAQVAPQLLTARRPAALMNLMPMAAAFQCTRAIGQLGMARPARWLVAWSPATERIPSAPRERYHAETVDVLGFGVLAIRRHVAVGRAETVTTTQTMIAVHHDNRTQLNTTASVPAPPTQLKMDATLMRDQMRLPMVTDELEEVHRPAEPGIHLHSLLAPQLGTFEPGDVVEVNTTATFHTNLTEDYVVIDQPTKLVVMRVVLQHPPTPLPPAMLTTTRDLDDMPYTIDMVKPRSVADSTDVEFVAVVSYPDPGSTIRLSWGQSKEQ